MFTYLQWLILHLCLRYKASPIIYFSNFLRKSTTTWVVKIELVQIYNIYAQTFQHVYIYVIEDYLDFVESLLGVTVSPIRNVCAKFGISISQLLLLFSFNIQEI